MRKTNQRLRRPRRDTPPTATILARGVATLGIVVFLLYLATQAIDGVPGRSYKTVVLSAPEVGSLGLHDPVRIAGVRVGQVRRIDVAGGRPRVELQLESGVRLPTDTRSRIRALGLLGSRFVELLPGRSRTELKDGATLRLGAADYTSGLPEALEVLDRPTRTGLRQTIDETSAGLLGNGASVNEMLRLSGPATARWHALSGAILAREGAVRRLAPAVRALVTPLDENRAALSRLTRSTTDVLTAFAAERGALGDTVERAPGTLYDLRTGLKSGRRLLTDLDGLAASANRTLPRTPVALRATTGLLKGGRGPLERARPLVEDLRKTVPSVVRVSNALRPALAPLRTFADRTRPILQDLIPKGCDIRNFGAVFRSMTGFSQPGRSGDSGPPQGFRAQAVTSLSTADLGIKDLTGLFKRDNYSPPCTWLSKTYEHLSLGGGG